MFSYVVMVDGVPMEENALFVWCLSVQCRYNNDVIFCRREPNGEKRSNAIPVKRDLAVVRHFI